MHFFMPHMVVHAYNHAYNASSTQRLR
jgi:hypothetical protein